jgi:hypothetical protein
LRAAVEPEIIIAPSTKHPHLQLVHTNLDMPRTAEFWNVALMFVHLMHIAYGILPMYLTLNHGAWETAVASNHLRVRRQCHAHAHIFYTREAAERIPMLKGRVDLPDFYRRLNVRHATALVDRYMAMSQMRANANIAARLERLESTVARLQSSVVRLAADSVELKKNIEEILRILRLRQ